MDNSRNAFLKAIKNFPRWMDIRKRPQKSTGGKFLQSIMDEHAMFKKSLDEFKKDFFLLSYVGREEKILSKIFVYEIGEVILSDISLVTPSIEITDDPRRFMVDYEHCVLYQDGYLMISPGLVPNDKKIAFKKNGYSYSGKTVEMPIWNIFDEFALFLSLERFEEESNKELLHRCFAAFKNPTSSTEAGLKNAIVNTMINILPVTADEIVIEKPSMSNVMEHDSNGEEIYEKLAKFNQDIFRTKTWDTNVWEHEFKKLDFLPHEWDAPIDVYQDGVGQMGDLKISFSNEVEDLETTDIEVSGYKADTVAINSYIINQNIKKEIPLKLEQYKNELKPKDVEFKITASPAYKLKNPGKVYVKSLSKKEGETVQLLEDIVIDSDKATVVDNGALTAGHSYNLKFKSRTPYSNMLIDRVDLVSGDKKKSLIIENDSFKKKDGTLKCIDVMLHVDKVNELKRSENIVNHRDGLQLGVAQTIGDMYIDVTGMDGNYISIAHTCEAEDITMNRPLVAISGSFKESDGNTLRADGPGLDSALLIAVEGYSLSFNYESIDNLGSCTALVTVDGKIDPAQSGLWTASKTFSQEYDHCAKIEVRIQKAGMHPIAISNIKAKRYRVETELQNDANQVDLFTSAYGTTLPVLPDGMRNILHIKLINLGIRTPVIQYIHVGASMENIVYSIPEFTANANESLDIRTNCQVELYDTTNAPASLISSDYDTCNTYKNDSEEDVYIGIDTSNFVSINSSSRKIETATSNGRLVKCIRIKPGEKLSSIIVSGTTYTTESRDQLKSLLKATDDDSVYVCKGAKGFIVKNDISKVERLSTIRRNVFSDSIDTVSFEGLPEEVTGIFSIDEVNEKIMIGNSLDRNFEYLYAALKEGQEYVAYNTVKLFQSPLNNVQLVNTFSPILDMTKLMYYEISEITKGEDTSSKAMFLKGSEEKTNWSLGLRDEGLQIVTDMGYNNSSSYNLGINRLNEAFTISNHIALSENYFNAQGEKIELARYIITPPEGMRIVYEEKMCRQDDIIIENDGFNKLWYSNVKAIHSVIIDGTPISPTMYEILIDEQATVGKEGIVLWKTQDLDGKHATIVYSYNAPVAMTYKSLMSLYDLVGYTTEAYKKIGSSIILSEVKDGDVKSLDFDGKKADKITVRCSNTNFQAVVEGNSIRVKKISQDNNALVKTGYYYDDGVEYYLFNNLHQEKIDRMSGVTLFNVKRNGDTLELIKKSTNHVKDSKFHPVCKNVLCSIDCKENPRIDGVSQLQAISACDSYNMWQEFNMDIELKEGAHDYGIDFKALDESSYAIMEITKIAKPGMCLSFLTTGTLEASILEEELAETESMQKSVFARVMDEITKSDSKYNTYLFTDKIKLNRRYYLMVKGSGLIDDIIACSKNDISGTQKLHIKNIEAVGFNIEEPLEKQTMIHLDFDSVGNRLDGIDIAKDGTIITGSNVDWGLTKIYDIAEDMNSCALQGVTLKKNAFYSDGKNSSIRTPKIFIENHKAINSLFIKVNDILIEKMSGFAIRAMASTARDGHYQVVLEQENTNIAQLFKTKLAPYLQIEVDMPAETVINTIEIYAEYAETDAPLHVVPEEGGELVSKVYNTAYAASYQLSQIEGTFSNMKDIDVYIRGCRRDTGHEVWTKWYKEALNDNASTLTPHTFEKYQLFQFKLILKSSKAKCSIKNFVLEVI